MNIVLWGTYDTGKPRIRILRDGLRAEGHNVFEIHASIWEGTEDKSSLRGGRKWLAKAFKLLCAYPKLIWRYLRAPKHDLVLVSYPGQIDVLLLKVFAWLRGKPLVLDWFISAYDTLTNDRHMLRKRNPAAWLIWCVEWLVVRSATLAFMDTAAHARHMEALFGLAPGSVGHVWVGAEELFFRHFTNQADRHHKAIEILFYGQFIPLHGIDTIVEAARIVHADPIHFTFIGRGQEAERTRRTLDKQPLPNLEWLDWVEYDGLPAYLANADVCLGIFGASDKAASVIPNKAFQILASGKPLITRDSPAIRELLDDASPCVQLIEADNASALAAALRKSTPIPDILDHADFHTQISSRITPIAIARQFEALIASNLSQPRGET